MASLNIFDKPMDVIVEIGPGSGRYLEKTLKAGKPAHYQIYETADQWSAYLEETFDVELAPTDGYSLPAPAMAARIWCMHIKYLARYHSW